MPGYGNLLCQMRKWELNEFIVRILCIEVFGFA